MPKLNINGIEIEVEEGMSVLQACEQLGIEIPRFCYHDKLSVPANCRMCLVEQKGAPKPMPSCALACSDGMEISTDSEEVQKARQGVMEFMLANHPLDCPICDQGGECDLQDQAVAYGFDRGRYRESKRAVEEKNFGPLIKTHMTRCIHCTRCVRFGEQIGGVTELGTMGRGEDMEISNFVGQAVSSELSGNMIDVCPVGALTSKPYAFKARPWELRKTETIDVMDAVGSNIRVDSRGNEVLRVLPRMNEEINECWISDKTRFSYDGLSKRRLDRPYIRVKGKLQEATWDETLELVAKKLKKADGKRIAALVGNQADCESIAALKDLMNGLGSPNTECRIDGAEYDLPSRAAYTFQSGIAAIDHADAILLVGAFPRHEATMVNARIRRAFVEREIPIAVVGEPRDYTYPYTHLGEDPRSLEELEKGKGGFAKIMKKAKHPMIIVGAPAFTRKDSRAIQALCHSIAERYDVVGKNWHGFNVLQLAASRVGALDLGFVPGKGGMNVHDVLHASAQEKLDILYLLGADNFNIDALGKKTFVIYQGHHGDVGAHRADVIFPGAAYTEKDATYVNTEGRPQYAWRAVFPPGLAKEDWKIIRALSGVMGQTLPYDTIEELRTRMVEINPVFKEMDKIIPGKWVRMGKSGFVTKDPFVTPVANFYQTCSISFASDTMKACTESFVKKNKKERVA